MASRFFKIPIEMPIWLQIKKSMLQIRIGIFNSPAMPPDMRALPVIFKLKAVVAPIAAGGRNKIAIPPPAIKTRKI